MTSKYELNKPYVKRYVATHREQTNAYHRLYHHMHLEKCREQNRRCQMKAYYLKKELERFRNILIQPL
jgi:hypothetical protein